MKEVILVTGVTGFLGSHIAEALLKNGYQIIATRRKNSDLQRCKEFTDRLTWIDVDDEAWQQKLIDLRPAQVIHAAWSGVENKDRDDWETQKQNLFFLQELLSIARQAGTKKFIGLGSQAEYGQLNKKVNEQDDLNTTDAYSTYKILCSQLLKRFSALNALDWYWLRVFSVFGERENESWLLPSVISNIINKKPYMEFSGGEQQYAYLYARDFAMGILKVIEANENKSGCYNLSGENCLKLTSIISQVRDKIDPNVELRFGSLPYRTNQSMVVCGNMTLFNKTFGPLPQTPLEESIDQTIRFYLAKQGHESI